MDHCTLRILHLPPTLSDESREELFKYYGALRTRTIRKSDKYTITFAEFSTEEQAHNALTRLHQLPVKGRRLTVEYAKNNISSVTNKENNFDVIKENEKEEQLSKSKAKYKEFLKKLNSWAPFDLVSQPVPPNLKYKYPSPTKSILMRISLQLVKEKAFYTQVLHLMNKMNLPPPFEELEGDFPVLKDLHDFENYEDLFNITLVSRNEDFQMQQEILEEEEEESEEEESEMESDEESQNTPLQIIPEKRRKRQPKKRLKISKLVHSIKKPSVASSSQKQKIQDVFDLQKVDSRSQKIILKPVESTRSQESTTTSRDNPNFVVQSTGNSEGFGLILPGKKEDEKKDEEPKLDFITTDQLHSNKISERDQRLLPVFNNYHPGKPSPRLYIKNLAKQVEESDLHFIYKRYVLPSSKSSESEYNVRLMQEGRMKGQAFITLPNTAQAQLALNETNGYILKDKPMVVQFAKVPKS